MDQNNETASIKISMSDTLGVFCSVSGENAAVSRLITPSIKRQLHGSRWAAQPQTDMLEQVS